jgi:ribosomal protein S18 acetylase RimI-like enzyme
MMHIEIKRVSPNIFDECAEVIRNSFITVADELKLTRENAPTNPAFIENDALNNMYEKKIDMFAVANEDECIGFVALEKAGNEVYYMERLAILPEYRHRGYGKRVLDFAVDFVRERKGKKISIGIINENEVLKNWYLSYGFIETETKMFQHLPFTVCFMEKSVN